MTVFELVPAAEETANADRSYPDASEADRPDPRHADYSDVDLVQLVDDVLASGPYQYGDFHELPMPLWLVRDRETSDAFRVAVRNGEIQLHVLPRTEAPGLQAFYDRVESASEDSVWRVRTRQKE